MHQVHQLLSIEAYVYDLPAHPTSGQKYHFLKHHFVPSIDHTYPEEYMGGCKRRFKLNWLNEMPGLVYSLLDGAFCFPCTIFVTDRDKYGLLVNKPFRAWYRILQSCITISLFKQVRHLLRVLKQPQSTVTVMHDTIKLKHTRYIIKAVANVVLYCGRQCIGLRGTEEYLNLPGNPGNFLALMRLLGKYNNDIKMHLEHPSLKNATYLSPRIQEKKVNFF